MRYSVITKIPSNEEDVPFLFEKDAREVFNNRLKDIENIQSDHDISMFLVDNMSNKIISSYCSSFSAMPVEYWEVKQVSTNAEQMIKNLHDLMSLKGISLTKLAIHSGINVSNLCRFFRPDSNPKLKTYVRVSKSINLL